MMSAHEAISLMVAFGMFTISMVGVVVSILSLIVAVLNVLFTLLNKKK